MARKVLSGFLMETSKTDFMHVTRAVNAGDMVLDLNPFTTTGLSVLSSNIYGDYHYPIGAIFNWF